MTGPFKSHPFAKGYFSRFRGKRTVINHVATASSSLCPLQNPSQQDPIQEEDVENI
jgi:hypothetical protein